VGVKLNRGENANGAQTERQNGWTQILGVANRVTEELISAKTHWGGRVQYGTQEALSG